VIAELLSAPASPNRAIFQRVLVRRKRTRQFQRLGAKLVSQLNVDDARA
jgi:hypothetical protein